MENEAKSQFENHLSFYWSYLHNNLWVDQHTLRLMDRGFAHHEKTLLAKLEEEVLSVEPHERYFYEESKREIEVHLKELVPTLVWKSCFLSFYSFLEHNLTELTNIVRNYGEYKLKVSEINKKGIIACKVYLSKVCNLDMTKLEIHWSTMDFYNELRHLFIHGNGTINKHSKIKNEHRKMLNNRGNISIVNEHLVVTREFCEQFLTEVDTFFRLLMTHITASYPPPDFKLKLPELMPPSEAI